MEHKGEKEVGSLLLLLLERLRLRVLAVAHVGDDGYLIDLLQAIAHARVLTQVELVGGVVLHTTLMAGHTGTEGHAILLDRLHHGKLLIEGALPPRWWQRWVHCFMRNKSRENVRSAAQLW